jgi:hypothetical protein
MGKKARGREARSRRTGGRIGVVLVLLAVCALWAAPARAADPYPAGDKAPTQVLGTSFFNDQPAAAAGTTGSVGGAGLAFTGAGILILLLTALVALVLGFVLWRSGHRRSAASDL